MKAAVLGERGVEIRDVAKPTPRPNEILVKVSAAALNRADVVIASGHAHGFAGGAGTLLGGECAGEITVVGGDGPHFKPRDPGWGSGPRSFSYYFRVEAGPCYKIPATAIAYD